MNWDQILDFKCYYAFEMDSPVDRLHFLKLEGISLTSYQSEAAQEGHVIFYI